MASTFVATTFAAFAAGMAATLFMSATVFLGGRRTCRKDNRHGRKCNSTNAPEKAGEDSQGYLARFIPRALDPKDFLLGLSCFSDI